MESECADKIFFAKLAEQAERYDEVVTVMNEVAKMPGELTVEGRNLLSVAYKNVIGARRSSWRVLGSIERREEAKGSTDLSALRLLKKHVEEELFEISSNILDLLDNHLIPNSQSTEAKVFFYKMKGDYHRYVAEFSTNGQRGSAAEASLVAYKNATQAAETLPRTHPIRLGLALNFSVFYYEILNHPERACEIARDAFDQAIAELDPLSEESYKDSTLIMQLLRDNLTLWTSDMTGDGKMLFKLIDFSSYLADKDLQKDEEKQ